MRRLIARCLIFSLLFANLAWAADVHAEAFFGHEAGWSQDADHSPDTGPAADTCDHCCHGGAHYTGMPAESAGMIGVVAAQAADPCIDPYLSFAVPPPTEPPIA